MGRTEPRQVREQQAKQKSETRPRPKVGRPAGQAATKRHDARDRGAYRSELQRRGGWAVDSGVEAHGQRAGRPGWDRGGTPGDRRAGPRVPRSTHRKDRGLGGCLAIVGLDPRAGSPGSVPGESRENGRPGEGWKSTTAAGDGPPRGGRVSPPSWARGRTPGLAVPGRARRGQAQRGERGSPTRRCLIGNPDPTRVRQGARGAACLEADGTLSHSGDPGHRGRGRWQATAKGGDNPTRRGLAGHRPPFQGILGVPGAP